jgi:hypothetical protein
MGGIFRKIMVEFWPQAKLEDPILKMTERKENKKTSKQFQAMCLAPQEAEGKLKMQLQRESPDDRLASLA